MKNLLIIIVISILFVSCGIKDKPEYKSQAQYNKNIYKI
jgi:hypothetical protein